MFEPAVCPTVDCGQVDCPTTCWHSGILVHEVSSQPLAGSLLDEMTA